MGRCAVYSISALLLWRGAFALHWPPARTTMHDDDAVQSRAPGQNGHAFMADLSDVRGHVDVTGQWLPVKAQSRTTESGFRLTDLQTDFGRQQSATSVWSAPAQSAAFVQKRKDAHPVNKDTAMYEAKLGDKQPGFCVNKDGGGLSSAVTGVAGGETECWKLCEEQPDWQACAYHYDTKQCVHYLGPAARANGWDGFYCRIKPLIEYELTIQNPCLANCNIEHVPTCSTYQTLVAEGGCAQYCNEDIKAKYDVFLCGKKPECAKTCSENSYPNCESYHEYTKAGGCGASCSEAMKLEFKTELCPMKKPECAASCPDATAVTCSVYNVLVSPGGCAEHCSEEVKHHYAQFVCGRKPLCAATCDEDTIPTCATVDNWVGAGKCADSCNAKIKADFREEVCEIHATRVKGWESRPECLQTCHDDYDEAIEGHATSCAKYKHMISPGECAAGCNQTVMDRMKKLACTHIVHSWGESVAGTAKSMKWGAPISGGSHFKPTTYDQAEQQIEKFDKIVEGAELEASLPDTRHTTPEPEEEEDKEEGLFGLSKKMTAGLLVGLCVCWCAAGMGFHRWALAPKSQQKLAETDEIADETEES